jgi:aminopeptidase N
VADLQTALERASGKDLGAYFDAWVFGTGSVDWPIFQVQTADAGSGRTEVTVTQQHGRAAPYPAVVEIELRSASQTVRTSVDFGLAPASNVARASAAFAGPVSSVVIDPDDRVMDLSVSGARRRVEAVRWHP